MTPPDLIIYNAVVVDDGSARRGWLAVSGEMIAAVGQGDVPADMLAAAVSAVDAGGAYLMPGAIDEHVHLRDPGMTQKGDMATETAAAAAGGVTSVIDMPNNRPPAVTCEAIEAKARRAAQVASANYAFYIGATNDNLSELLAADYSRIAGVKLFLGSSTGNMLVDDGKMLDELFARVPALIAVHAEDEAEIARCREAVRASGDLSVARHPDIRSRRACLLATTRAIDFARRHGSRLHVLHVSTAEEAAMFSSGPIGGKRITAETCPQYLLFDAADYARLGARIKCNPAVKSDAQALLDALADGRIDTVATDHAPHLPADKTGDVLTAASGMPMLQFALPAMVDRLGAVVAVTKMANNPARLFAIDRRGFLRPGYFADMTLVAPRRWTVTDADVISRCGWTPLDGMTLGHAVTSTLINGSLVFDGATVNPHVRGHQLIFNHLKS